MRIGILAICAISLTLASSDASADLLPFTEGVIYEYERIPQHLGTYMVYFSGTADIEGTTTHVRRFDDGQQQFWSETPESDKLLHGTAFRLEPPLLFHPPILWVDEPLFVGKIWEVESQDSDSLAFHIRFEVTAFGDVTVPAGTFQAFTIRETVEYPEGGGADKVRRLVRAIRRSTDTTQQVTEESYADGIGHILITFGSRTDRLFSLRTVAVQPSTWTRIRMLYR
jgi:hypothetical protein